MKPIKAPKRNPIINKKIILNRCNEINEIDLPVYFINNKGIIKKIVAPSSLAIEAKIPKTSKIKKIPAPINPHFNQAFIFSYTYPPFLPHHSH